MSSVRLAIAACIFVSSICSSWSVDPLVYIDQGVVQGSWSDDGDYSMFLGIPFALVDANNPFGDALPAPQLEGIFEANSDSAVCPQMDALSKVIMGNLDCLHVNVYVPQSASISNPLPVMVWIYGGGFREGSFGREYFGPQYLLRYDVVVVTLNYRVGPYGFMCLDTPSVPGNTGLKDQRRGLEWVKNNIAAFGGDVNSITAFGESAGAMSLEIQIISPGSSGLFNRAILQSGSALVEQVVIHSRPSAPIEIAKYLGFDAETMEDALDHIKSLPTDDVISAAVTLGITFKPCVEKEFESVENVLTDFPDNILRSGEYQNVPIIQGYNSAEQMLNYLAADDSGDYYDRLQTVIYNRINGSFDFKTEEELNAVAKIVKEFYVGTQPVDAETIWGMINFDSDAHFTNPIERSIKYRMGTSNFPIYQYVFAYSGEINFDKLRQNITAPGAAHADDLAYVFKQSYTPDENTPEDQLIIDRMTTMWTNFAKYGDPTPEVTELLPISWPAVSEEREFLLIDSDMEIDRKPFHSRVAFWDLLFEAYGDDFRMVWSSCQNCVDNS